MSTSARPSVIDSPWFWAVLFCAVGVGLLLAFLPKYSRRQQRLELQYYARQEILSRETSDAGSHEAQPSAAPADVPQWLIIPLWPLVGLLLAGLLVSSIMLWRARR